MHFIKFRMYFTYTLFLFVILTLLCPTLSLSAYPKLVSTLINAFDVIKTWIIRIATPAAAVAVRYRSIYAKV